MTDMMRALVASGAAMGVSVAEGKTEDKAEGIW